MAARVLPCSVDAEKFILGSVLMDSSNFRHCHKLLTPDHFSLENHRRIFRRMQSLYEAGSHVDRITVANELLRYGELESVGGLTYLVSLDDGLPQIPNIESYIGIVREKYALRQIIFASERIQHEALQQEQPALDILRNNSELMSEVELDLHSSEGILSAAEVLDRHTGGINHFMEGAVRPGISTGYANLDDHIMGLQEGGHYIIGGSTGSGKTALLNNISINVASKGHPVVTFSLEMDRDILLARAVCGMAKVPFKYYIRGELTREQEDDFRVALHKITKMPWYVDDRPSVTVSQFITRCNRAVSKYKARLICLDYLQIIDWRSDKSAKLNSEYEGVTAASLACRMVARKHGISTIALSQLSRANGKRKEGEKPTLSDLKASGAIENDAMAVMLLHRPELLHPEDRSLRGQAEILVRKARVGHAGNIKMTYQGYCYRWEDTEQDDNSGDSDE